MNENATANLMPQSKATMLLRDAAGAGLKPHEMAPPLMRVHVGSHDTGCQPQIYLQAPEARPVRIWQGSVWYSSCYDFNDREKVLGVQPGCEFAVPMLAEYFAAVEQRYNEVLEERAAAKMLREVESEHDHERTLAHYRALLGSS